MSLTIATHGCSGGDGGTSPARRVATLEFVGVPGDTLTLGAGETQAVSVKALDSDGNDVADAVVTASSSNTTVATVTQSTQTSQITLTAADFTIRAVQPGSAVITFRHIPSSTSRSVSVTVPVSDPPAIGLSRASIDFVALPGGSNPEPQIFQISNTGGGTLSWSVSDDVTWLTETPASGTNAGLVTLIVDAAGLTEGTETAIVTVSAAGAESRTLVVTLTLTAPGGITVSVFGGTPDPDGFTVFIDGVEGLAVAPNATVTITGLVPGEHTVALHGLASNCIALPASALVSVVAGMTTTVGFEVLCF